MRGVDSVLLTMVLLSGLLAGMVRADGGDAKLPPRLPTRVKPAVDLPVQYFDLADVRLGDGPFKQVHTEMLPHSTSYVSVLYGPIVLAGELGREGLVDADFRTQLIADRKMSTVQNTPAWRLVLLHT